MQRYQVAQSAEQLCTMIGVSRDAIMRHAGLSATSGLLEKGATAREYFAFFSAAKKMSNLDDFSLSIGRAFSGNPHNSETAAFILSPDVKTGLERLAIFKPLICPVRAGVSSEPVGLRFNLYSNDPKQPIPSDFQPMHPIFILSLIRVCTGREVVPLEVCFDGPEIADPEISDFLGVTPRKRPFVSILIALEDAQLPLLSSNAQRWGWLEQNMQARLEAMERDTSLEARVACALIELLPAGFSGIDAVSDKIHMSKRSLQRLLREHGLTYQEILSKTRRDLAQGYLCMPSLTIEEIAYLLAYREPNSFYRAFQSWTGTTPLAFRSLSLGA